MQNKVMNMQLETPQVKSSDNIQAKNQAENLSIQNQVIEGVKPGDTKAATATATAQLESKGDLPKVAIFDSANSASDLAATTAKAQPEAQTANTNLTGKVTTTAESALTANDLKALNSSIGDLKADETALAKAPTSTQDLSKVNDDEKSLRTNELAYMHASSASTTFAAYSQSMASDKPELTNIATGLWKMGQKSDASQTTSYFPTSNYEKYFNNGSTGTGPNPGDPSLKNETSYTNMQDDTWNKNLKAGEIGGTGINPDMQLSTSGNKMTATMSGGGYTDGLISNTQKLNPNDNTVQLNYDVNVKAGSDLHCLEDDAAITTGKQADGKVLTAMAASQFVMDPKTGEMSFDTSGTNHQWVDAINDIPMPKDGTNMDVSMTVKMVGNNYEYTGLNVDGKSYAINSADSTFAMTQIGPKGWTPDTIHTQLQQDLGAAGGSSTVTYNDVQVNQGNS
jgi:hypothetical protein